MVIKIAQEPHADEVLNSSPFAFLVGMMHHQQISDGRRVRIAARTTSGVSMGQKSDVIFVFTRDGDVEVFDGIEAAEGWIEAIDVLDGEYSELFRIDGERLTLTAIDNVSPVVVQGTGELEPGHLADRQSTLAERNGFDGTDPVAIANQALAFRWKSRWPRWPRWLDRRMNGDGPPSV